MRLQMFLIGCSLVSINQLLRTNLVSFLISMSDEPIYLIHLNESLGIKWSTLHEGPVTDPRGGVKPAVYENIYTARSSVSCSYETPSAHLSPTPCHMKVYGA